MIRAKVPSLSVSRFSGTAVTIPINRFSDMPSLICGLSVVCQWPRAIDLLTSIPKKLRVPVII